jgi:hypothetical protein
MPGMVVDSALALDQLRHSWQGPQSRFVAERFGASLQGILDLAQISGSQACLAPPSATRLQSRGSCLRKRGRPAADGLPMHSNFPCHIGLTPTSLQQLRCLQAATLQGFKIALDPSGISHERTLHEKC